MALPWIRLDTNMPDHPKVLGLLTEKDGRALAFVDGTVGAVHVKSTHGPAKGRWVMVYRRTGKAIPEHVCEVAG